MQGKGHCGHFAAPEFQSRVFVHLSSQTVAPPMLEAPLDLSYLYRQCLFRSDTAVDSHDQAARELAEHNLHWRRGVVDTVMYKARVRQMQMFALRYGPEVEITPQPTDGFLVVHLSLKGCAEIIADGDRMLLTEGRTGWMAPRKTWRMRWQSGAEQLIIKIPNELLRAPGKPDQPIELAPTGVLPRTFDPQWRSLIQTLLHAASAPTGSVAGDEWLDHFERIAGAFLVAHGSPIALASTSAGSDDPHAWAQHGDTLFMSALSRVEAMENYVRRHLAAPVSLADLALAAGVSPRTLQDICLTHRGATPMEVLRGIRLDAVRARLLEEEGTNVTEVAFRFGFSHLGRFATYYRDRFGELPSVTSRPIRR
jgi:AraC-like DNA-binding protein